ncbi:hypothetical protein BJ165DRAFT_1504977 [Panaeolus papilionaceus]|nr:hypothetical protein BJ165DRAFT_1504977 [Panaeolus papilionaceus]
MTTASTEGVKKKKPPTFQHYPANRGISYMAQLCAAKKLKKAWIDKAKIKSKWKAQKKKEGLMERSKLGIAEIEGNNDKSEEEDEEKPTHSDRAQSVEQSPTITPSEPTPTIIAPPQTKKAKRDSREHRNNKRKRELPEEPTEPKTLRDLTREAYSRSSLHTFKSHPLRKGKTARHELRLRGEKGRGQPNMKLRMNAMLAKIKQDYA